MDNMTALVSCFARAYHYRNSESPVFADTFAEQLLTAEEYDAISRNMAQGIGYFAPGFQGTSEEALRFIVNHQLAPSVLPLRGDLPGRGVQGRRRGGDVVFRYRSNEHKTDGGKCILPAVFCKSPVDVWTQTDLCVQWFPGVEG